MRAGDLRDVIAAAMLVEPSKVWVTMRNLRENGLQTTGARGVNAPDMTYLDAARILIAHILDPNPGRAAPRLVRTFGSLEWAKPAFPWEGDAFTIGAMLPGRSTATLEDTLAALLEVFAEHHDTEAFRNAGRVMRDGRFFNPICSLEIFEEDARATIDMAGAHYAFDHGLKNASDATLQDDARFRLGRQASAVIYQEVLALVAQGFRSVREVA